MDCLPRLLGEHPSPSALYSRSGSAWQNVATVQGLGRAGTLCDPRDLVVEGRL